MIHNFDPVFIDLGLFQIRWYSIAYIISIVLGWIYAKKIIGEMASKHNFTLFKPQIFDDLIIYLIIGIVLGGRLGYVIFYNFGYYSQNLDEILKLWKGGMSFHGGLLGIVIATLTFSKIKKKYVNSSARKISSRLKISQWKKKGVVKIDGTEFETNLKAALILPDGKPDTPTFLVFENYEKILKWNRSLRFGISVCTLANMIKI